MFLHTGVRKILRQIAAYDRLVNVSATVIADCRRIRVKNIGLERFFVPGCGGSDKLPHFFLNVRGAYHILFQQLGERAAHGIVAA